MKLLWTSYRDHFGVLILGILWLVLFDGLTQMSVQGVMHSDAYNYQEAAKNLYIFHTGHIYRPIGMSLIFGFPYLFGSSDAFIFKFAFGLNIVFWLATLILLFEIFQMWLRKSTAVLLLLAFMTIIGSTSHVFFLLTETIFTFLMVLAFYALIRFYQNKRFLWLSLALSIFLFSMIIKPGATYLAILMMLWNAKQIIGNLKSKAMYLLYLSTGLVLVQCFGMLYQFGNFTVSYIDAPTYYGYIGSKAVCIREGREYRQINNPRADYIFSSEAKDQKKIAAEDFKDQLQNNAVNLGKAYVSDVVENTKSGNSCVDECKNIRKVDSSFFDFWRQLFFDISKWQNRFFTVLSFVLAALFFLKSFRKPNVFTAVGFYILYIVLLSGISCGQGDRFHLVTFPFGLLLLAKWLEERGWFTPTSEPLQK